MLLRDNWAPEIMAREGLHPRVVGYPGQLLNGGRAGEKRQRDIEARSRLAAAGPGPLAVTLATGGLGEGDKLDLRRSNGVVIWLSGRMS
jgi:hypothetical protein